MRVSEGTFHLAQVNIGVLRAPRDSPLIADFVANLEPINALADASPGFVWRLQGEGGDATSFRAFDSDTILINMSTWESLEALQAFVYRTAHTGVMRRRREWFEPMADLYMALWWVPAGHRTGDRRGRGEASAAPAGRSLGRRVHLPPAVPSAGLSNRASVSA